MSKRATRSAEVNKIRAEKTKAKKARRNTRKQRYFDLHRATEFRTSTCEHGVERHHEFDKREAKRWDKRQAAGKHQRCGCRVTPKSDALPGSVVDEKAS